MSAPSRTVMPRNRVGIGIANARSDPSRSSSWPLGGPAASRPVTPPAVTGPNLTCVVERPLHAVVLPVTDAGGRLLELLAAALDGSGPAVLPLDPDLPADRLAAILDTFAPAAVHTADGVRERPGGRPVQPGTALMIATSGSTGQPKGVELGAAALRHSARATLDRIGAPPGQRWLLCLPATHIAGIQVLIRSLTAGTDPVVVTRADADVLAGSGGAHVSIVPTQLPRLVGADPAAAADGRRSVRGLGQGVHLGAAGRGGRARRAGRGGPRRRGAGGHHLRDERDLRRLRLRRSTAGRCDDRHWRPGWRPDPDQRAGAVLRLPGPAGPDRGGHGRCVVRHIRSGNNRRRRAAGSTRTGRRRDHHRWRKGGRGRGGHAAGDLSRGPGGGRGRAPGRRMG